MIHNVFPNVHKPVCIPTYLFLLCFKYQFLQSIMFFLSFSRPFGNDIYSTSMYQTMPELAYIVFTEKEDETSLCF